MEVSKEGVEEYVGEMKGEQEKCRGKMKLCWEGERGLEGRGNRDKEVQERGQIDGKIKCKSRTVRQEKPEVKKEKLSMYDMYDVCKTKET